MNLRAEAEEKSVAKLPWAHLRLPPFPQVAIRVLQLANNENVQLHQLCDLISSDPAFASEVLTVANSLLYAPRYPSTSILQAVAVLGANTLQGMCVTVGIRAYLGRQMNLPAMRKLWRHNLACAIIAQRMAGAGFIDSDQAYTSGILHDIGTFISPQSHQKHSSYLIDAADIFGLRKADKDIVSKVALYHRRQVPGPSDPAYMSLSRHDRAVVSKLAAILRVSEALDKSHQQKIRDFTLERDRDMIMIHPIGDPVDLSMERQALAKKDSLFTDVLGAILVLKQEAVART